MTLPPVIHRELTRRASRSKTWWIRFSVVAATALAWFFALTSGAVLTGTGKTLLISISIIPLFIALCGVVTTADCLARDKRDRTIELLLLTRLHPVEIIFHKLLATTAPVFSGLLAITPLSLIAVSIGGVSGTEAAAVGVLTLATALLSAAFGMFISSFTRSILAAMAATFCLSALFFGTCLVPAVQAGNSLFATVLNLTNPFELLRTIFFEPTSNVTTSELLTTAAMSSSAALGLLLASALLLPRLVQAPAALRTFSTFVTPERIVALACLMLAPVLLFLCLIADSAIILIALALLAGSLAKIVVLASTVRILNMRPWMEVILTTPLPPNAYIRTALLRSSPRILSLLAVTLIAEIIILARLPPGYRIFGLAISSFLVLDTLTLIFVGLWNGLKFENLSEAMSLSLTSVLLVPIGIAGTLLAFGFRTETIAGGVLLWAILRLTTDALAAASAKWMLHHRLRQAASSTV